MGCGEDALPGAPSSKWPLLSVAEANAVVLAHCQPLAPVEVPLSAAVGLILAECVTAPEPLPAFYASIKDGYAVIAADGVGEFPVVGDVRAGGEAIPALKRGTVAYITTGGALPPGADAVIQVEHTIPLEPAAPGGPRRVRILKAAARPGQDIRPIGSDIAAGAEVLRPGERLGPAEIGLLATVGAARVRVLPRPLVAVLSTGDELADPEEAAPGTLPPGAIRDSNRAMLLAAAAEAGADVLDLEIARDSAAAVEEALDRALAAGAHVLLSTGGVSMGDHDFVKPTLERRGVVHFGRVLMKPGKPLTFATVPAGAAADAGPMLVFGLPGNPVSSLVTFHLAVVPALRKLAGWPRPELRRVWARLGEPLPLDAERPEYHRAGLTWDPLAHCFVANSTGRQISSRLLSMRSASALLELPQAEGILPMGALVPALLLPHFEASLPPTLLPAQAAVVVAAGATVAGAPLAASRPAGAPGSAPLPSDRIRVAIITVSDTVASGAGPDKSGPATVAAITSAWSALGGVEIVSQAVVPDDQFAIQAALAACVDGPTAGSAGAAAGPHLAPHLVLTTGGTGFAPRDITPEAVRPMLHREAPGLATVMLNYSLAITPTAMLSRAVAGTRGSTLIITLPGNPRAAGECLAALMPALPHALRQLRGQLGGTHKAPPVPGEERHLPHAHEDHGDCSCGAKH